MERQQQTNSDLRIVLIFFTALILIVGAIYFGKIRPDGIKEECRDKAIVEALKVSPVPSPDTATITNVSDTRNWTQRMIYQKCLREKGITE